MVIFLLEIMCPAQATGRKATPRMNQPRIKQRPLHLMEFGKRDLRTQFGAVCWRQREGETEILLVTSRGTGRWIIPKGWPLRGTTAARAAANEAWEEAGVTGIMHPVSLGIYSYEKVGGRRRKQPVVVAVFSLHVTQVAEKWPEMRRRTRRWVTPAEAAEMVQEPELRALLLGFVPPEVLRADEAF
jgi:8-oxo-dGTP pyrophosphatase MutT (NUDIX family)